MAFFDRLNEMAKTVSEKTNDSLEINKLIGEINLTKGNIQSFQRELGEHFWAKFVTGEQFDDEAMMICDKIVAAQDKIHDMEAQIAQIKAEGEARKAEREAERAERKAAEKAAEAPGCPIRNIMMTDGMTGEITHGPGPSPATTMMTSSLTSGATQIWYWTRWSRPSPTMTL